MVTFFTYDPNIPKITKITGTNAAHTPAKSAPLYIAIAMPLIKVDKEYIMLEYFSPIDSVIV